ncbi:MAG: MMPL family transporter, partial [Kiloniellales bacterium]
MTSTAMHAGRRLLVHWVRLVRRSAVAVLALALLLTMGALQVTVTSIGINTSTTDMLSEELPFRRYDRTLSQAFPQLSDNLTVVIEAATPDLAEDAARRLAAELGAHPRLFRDVFYPEGDGFFRRNGLLYLELDELQALGDRLAEVQPLLSALAEDPSLRGLSAVLRLGLDARPAEAGSPSDAAAAAAVAPALDRLAAVAESLAAQRAGGAPAQPLSWRALLSGEDPEPADKRRFISLWPVLDFGSLAPAAEPIAAVRRIAGDLGLDEAAGVRLRLTGEAVMFQEELLSLRDGMGLVGLLSVCMVIGLLILGLRSPRLVGATLATLIMGLIWTAGFATLAVGELNLISVAFAVLFIGLSVDFGIHFALRYQEAVEAQASDTTNPGALDPGAALDEAARGVGGALSLCALAAAIGFFSFLPTAYRGVAELGLIAGAGMFIALFANLTVLPAIMSLLPLRPGGRVLHSPLGDRVQHLVTRRPRRVIGGALALGLGAAALLPFAWFDDDPLNLRDPGSESVATLFELFDDPRVTPYSAAVLADDLAAGEALAARLEALPEVASARVLSDLVPAQQDDKLALIDEMGFFLTPVFDNAGAAPPPGPAEKRRALGDLRASLDGVRGALAPGARRLAAALDALAVPETAPGEATLGELERLWLAGFHGRLIALGEALEAERVSLGDLPAQLRARNLSAEGRARVVIEPRQDLREPAARRRFVDAVRQVAPAVAGAPVTLTEAGSAVLQAFGEAAVTALVLIVVLLLVLLRSAWDSMMVLAPLVLAALLTVGVTVALGIPFNFANVIVLPLLFGLGVASGIHMVLRARAAGAAGLLATSTPRAVLFSALTTIGSFGALALSSHRGTASMGVLLTIAITLTMLCTLIVLPALLSRPARPAPAGRRPGLRALGLGRLLTLLAGIALLAYVATRTDLAEVWERLVDLGALGVLAMAAVFFAAFLIDTASWQLMLPSVRLNGRWLYHLWKVRMVGEALNLVIPAGSLGGEPVKAVLLKRAHGIGYREGAASLFIAKTVNLLALIAFATIGLALMAQEQALPRSYLLAAGLGLAALGLGVGGLYAVQRWGAASFLARRLLARRLAARLEGLL